MKLDWARVRRGIVRWILVLVGISGLLLCWTELWLTCCDAEPPQQFMTYAALIAVAAVFSWLTIELAECGNRWWVVSFGISTVTTLYTMNLYWLPNQYIYEDALFVLAMTTFLINVGTLICILVGHKNPSHATR